jgi:hypothetical protein
LIKGILVLYKSDPVIEYYGSIDKRTYFRNIRRSSFRKDKALNDLEEKLCNYKLIVSQLIINFREGLINTNYNPNTIKRNQKRKKI